MQKIVECVPNFSEGRDQSIINKITDTIKSVPAVTLLDVDPGESTNRTVVTFVGSPDGVVEAAFQAAKTAYELIDMTKHNGEHPRIGAVDVVPFVPVANVTMEECVELSKQFGKRGSYRLQTLPWKNALNFRNSSVNGSVKNSAYRFICMKKPNQIPTGKLCGRFVRVSMKD